MAEDTSLSFAQATSLQLTGCAIQEHLLRQKGLHRQGSVLLLCGVKVLEPTASTLASLEEFL